MTRNKVAHASVAASRRDDGGGGGGGGGGGVLNFGSDDESRIRGFRRNGTKQLLVGAAYVLSLGFLWLVFHWKPGWRLACCCDPCSLADADQVLVQDQYFQIFVHEVTVTAADGVRIRTANTGCCSCSCLPDEHRVDESADVEFTERGGVNDAAPLTRHFYHKKVKFVWNSEQLQFERLSAFTNTDCQQLHESPGCSETEAARLRAVHGDNYIHIPLTSIPQLLLMKALHPFYIFQVFSVLLWYNDEYEMYATCILVISVLSLSLTVFQTARNERHLRRTMVASCEVTVLRGGGYVSASSQQLVPGDVISIPRSGCPLHCDAVLLSGNCIVNESSLTGESVPVLKTELPASGQFSLRQHARHVLYCGTQVVQTRFVDSGRVLAVVLRTGYATTKGEMVRSILFPKPVEFAFNRDIVQYLLVLAGFAVAGFVYTLALMLQRDYPVGKIVLRALDLVTIIVPPALPAAMTVGVVFAQNRLQAAGIFCISPNSISGSGLLDVVCFDKTGTLTEDGLDLKAVVPSRGREFEAPTADAGQLEDTRPVVQAMAVCHSLTHIDSELSGDPLDLKMFGSTGWQLEEPETVDYRKYEQLVAAVARSPGGEELGIVRQFAFSSELQRMAVVARRLGDRHFAAFVKGSPEVVASLSLPATVPDSFHEQLQLYTRQGYRVIALATKQLQGSYVKVQKLSREAVECELSFLGLLVLENRLKPQSRSCVQQLLAANIRTVMVTGDNLLTALSVARDCGIVAAADEAVVVSATPEMLQYHRAERMLAQLRQSDLDVEATDCRLVIDGQSWLAVRQHFGHLLPQLAVKGSVFARFSPEQKAQLVEELQRVGYTVGMCGDGANDCGALKAAHAGVALSEAEASVASPFTSRQQNISCVPTLIREGRCAVVTAFGIFKFMACYSITQFVSCLILYSIGCNLTDGQFLFIDMFVITSLSITFGYTRAHPHLHPQPPESRLLSVSTVTSITLQAVLAATFQTLSFVYVQWQPWFTPFHMDIMADDYASYESTAVFVISAFQYTAQAVALAKAAPYRRPAFTNYPFLLNVIIVLAGTLYVCIEPFDWLMQFLELVQTPASRQGASFKSLLLSAALCHLLLSLLAESLADSWLLAAAGRRIRRLRGGGWAKEFERIAEDVEKGNGGGGGGGGGGGSSSWPPADGHSERP